MENKKKIFLSQSLGFVIKNFLMSNFYEILKDKVEFFIFSSNYKEDNFLREMEKRNLKVFPLLKPEPYYFWKRIKGIRDGFHVAFLDNETWKLKRSPLHHKMSKFDVIKAKILLSFFKIFTGKKSLILMDKLESSLALKSKEAKYYKKIFSEIRPDIFFSPSPLVSSEWVPLQVARDMGIKTALYILSWDNLSTKQRPPFPVDYIFLWSERMKEELLKFYPGSEKIKIYITGSPQFDFYFDPKYQEGKEEFFKRIGFSPERPLIVYSGVTPSLMPYENLIVENLISVIKEGKILKNPQLLVRLHPKDGGERYKDLMEKYRDVYFSIPGKDCKGEIDKWFPNGEEIKNLVSIVKHCDILINIASTMTVDGSILNKPVINVKYYLEKSEKPPWGVLIYETTHYKPLTFTGGFKIANSPEELVKYINIYLENPKEDEEGRKKIVEMVCGKVDGKAGERIAKKFLEIF